MRALTVDLLTNHQKLVADVANKMARRYAYPDVEDLIGEGRSIMLTRASKWQPSRGKFSTYLTWCLRNGLLDYIKRQKRMVASMQIDECVPDCRCSDSLPSRLRDLCDGLKQAGKEAALEVIHVCLTTDLGDVFKSSKDHQAAQGRVRWEMFVRGHNETQIDEAFADVQGLISEGW